MPITLGPQASCSTRYPRYGKNIDPTISPTQHRAPTPRPGPRAGPRRARRSPPPSAWASSGAARCSTTSRPSTPGTARCARNSALWFLHAWTSQLHRPGLRLGLLLQRGVGHQDARRPPRAVRTTRSRMPDQVWIADWNGKANTSSSYVRSDGWQPYRRMKQYQGGHNETWGGVRINIDRNYLNLRTPKIPGAEHAGTGALRRHPAPKYTGNSTSDARCTPVDDHPRDYPTINQNASAHVHRAAAVPAQAAAPLQVRGHRQVEQPDPHRAERLPGECRAPAGRRRPRAGLDRPGHPRATAAPCCRSG